MNAGRLAYIAIATVLLGCRSTVVAAAFRVSLSVSPYSEEMFASGYSFTDGKLTATDLLSLQRLYIVHGANEVYARIETRRTPIDGVEKGDEDE